MKRIALAIGTLAMGVLGSASALFGQATVDVQIHATAPVRQVSPSPAPPVLAQESSRPNYSLYGGPTGSQGPTRGRDTPGLGPVYKMYGVPDEITADQEAREARRNAAVEFGMYRRQFTGSTEFWMDYDRTRLAKARYSMDEAMWRGIHPLYEFGDGGYMYNTATTATEPLGPGSAARMTITVPEPNTRPVEIVNNARAAAPVIRQAPTAPNKPSVAPANRLSKRTGPLFVGGPESVPADKR